MKWIKKIAFGFFFILLVNLILLLVISFNIKKIIIDGIITETITEKISKTDWKEANLTITEEQINQITNDERVREILKSKEVQDLMNKYLEITIDTLTDEEEIDQVQIEKDILNYLKDNKEVLSSVVGEEITDEMIDKTEEQFEGKDISKIYKQTMEKAKRSMTTKERMVLKGYKVLISNLFRIIVSILIVLNIVLIALIQKSFYKWVKTLGIALVVTGNLIIIMSIVVKLIIKTLSTISNFNLLSLYISSAILIIWGVLLIIVFKIIEKKKGDIDEVS